MCKCNPNIRTPFCGKPGCEWPTPTPQAEYERRFSFALQEAAQAWTEKETKYKEMDTILATAFARILVKHMYAPHLGLATTGEMLDEIKSRVDLDYKTVNGDV